MLLIKETLNQKLQKMTDVILCVDIGTTSLKAGFITAAGEVVSFCSKKFSNIKEHYISLCWIDALKNAVKKLMAVDNQIVVKGIAVSGNGPTLVSESGFTLLWNEFPPCDSESVNYSGSSIFIPRILLFKSCFEKEFTASKMIFSGPEFFIWKLTKNAFTILPELRYESAYWNKNALSSLNIQVDKFPEFVELGHNCGLLEKTVAETLGLPVVPVFGIGPDFIAGLIGTDTIQNGKLCDRCGSSEGINFCTSKAIFHKEVRTLPCVTPELWNVSVLIPDSSSLEENIRLEKVVSAVKLLKKLAKENNLVFPDKMSVTGGQVKDKKYFYKKKMALKKENIDLYEEVCPDAELLGDAKIGWKKFLTGN